MTDPGQWIFDFGLPIFDWDGSWFLVTAKAGKYESGKVGEGGRGKFLVLGLIN